MAWLGRAILVFPVESESKRGSPAQDRPWRGEARRRSFFRSVLPNAQRDSYRPAKKPSQASQNVECRLERRARDRELNGPRRRSFKILSVPTPTSKIQDKNREALCVVVTC